MSLASGTRSVAIGRRGVIIMWGVTAGKARHNTSNARAVTVGKMGRNSSINNASITHKMRFLYKWIHFGNMSYMYG